MSEKQEFLYQRSDSKLELQEEDGGFELLQLVHENNLKEIKEMGVPNVIPILLSLLSLKEMGTELVSGSRKNETLLLIHLRDYIEQSQKGKTGNWHKPFLAFLRECNFSDAEVRALLNGRFSWDAATRQNMDIAARSLGAPPVFAGYSPHETGAEE